MMLVAGTSFDDICNVFLDINVDFDDDYGVNKCFEEKR